MSLKVVCEIGVNWSTLEEAKTMIAAAKSAGAYAVKFQLFNEETIKGSPYEDALKKLILSGTMLRMLRKCADKNEIAFGLTPMYLEAVKMASKYGDFIKIRYADHENAELVNAAVETGKPVLISVPRPSVDPRILYSPRIYQLYCLPRYPPDPEDFNLDVACVCKGFSSHYPHTILDLAFAINRAYEDSYLEKHVMQTPKFVDGEYVNRPIDENVSIRFEELKNFIRQLNIINKIKRTRLK